MRLFAVIISCLLSFVVSMAQDASITGRVLRGGRTPMANARVIYSNSESGVSREAFTDRNGTYHLTGLPLAVAEHPAPASSSLRLAVSNSVGSSRTFYFGSTAPLKTARIYDILGRQAAEIDLRSERRGSRWISSGFWDGTAHADGIYFAAVTDGSAVRAARFLNLRSGPAIHPLPLTAQLDALLGVDSNAPRNRYVLDDTDYRVHVEPGTGGPRFEAWDVVRSLHEGDNGTVLDSVHWAIPHRVLFVGNSYTFYNNGMDAAVQNLAISADPLLDFYCMRQAEPGYSFQDHWTNPNTRAIIDTGRWDMVILQEQSQRPVLEPDSVFMFARLLDSVITATGAQTAFFMTWAREYDPPMIEGLAAVYDSLGRELAAPVAPCGRAFQNVFAQDSTFVLHISDGSHPNLQGTYLAACVFYGMIFRASPVGIGYVIDPSITDEQRQFLQTVAWQTVQQYPPLLSP
jgi:hypothetical protein